MAEIIIGLYTLSNFVAMYYIMFISEEIEDRSIFEEGVKVKHLIFMVTFLPAEVFLGVVYILVVFLVIPVLDSRPLSTLFATISKTLNKKIFK